MKWLIVAKNTFRETIRDRVLYNLILFFLLITASALFLGDLTGGNEARTTVNIGLSATLIFGVLIAIFVGVGLVSKEIEKRTIYVILAKRVTRAEFLLGKYLGLCTVLLLNTGLMGIGVSVVVFTVGDLMRAISIWGAVFLIYMELCIITAVALVFSTFSSPILSTIFSFSVFVIGHFSSALKDIAQSIGSTSAKVFFTSLYYLLPNFSLFSITTQAAHGNLPTVSYLISVTTYAIFYILILISLAIIIFQNRDFR
ncbi:MAG: ABC transporter permease [Pyrinomonadaceae bacterium]|nr:ABC transporter permease [Pyrinomonadaceae bacterium]MCX7639671.1 ABC transporter permease [Pyrinomonadaceae bacterium]MDW8303311.1 ABC transporter permease [Acidobacteriota bacterium]